MPNKPFAIQDGIKFPDGTIQTTAYTDDGGGVISTFFVVANDDGTVSKSTDGVTWTSGVDTGEGIGRVATDGVTVAMIQSGQLTWTTFAGLEESTYVSGSGEGSDQIGGQNIDWNQIDYAGGYFVAVGSYTPSGESFSQGVYGYSTDGQSWTFATVDQTVVEYFGNNPVDSDWFFSDVDYNGVGWMFSVGADGAANGGGVYITDLTATVTSARCFGMTITYRAAWNGSAWYMEGEDNIAGVNTNLDPRDGDFDGPIDPWATGIQDLGISAGSTEELAGGNGYIAASDGNGHVAWSDDNGVTWQIVTPIPYTGAISAITQDSPAVVSFGGGENSGGNGEKVVISGSQVSGYNGTFYWGDGSNGLYTDQALTTLFDTTGLAEFTGTATLTWSNGQYIDAMDYINGYFYIGNDDEQIARTTNFVSWTILDDQGSSEFNYWNDIAGFVSTGSDRLVNGAQTLVLNANGSVTFPTLTVPISDNASPSGTGQTIKFSDSTQQAIIYGPAAEDFNAERIIIQGAPGYTGTAGEGGDVYLWAGPGGSVDGGGGDIKVRGGQGIGTGTGGYLNFQAGDSDTGVGGYINIESGESNTYGSGGDITVRAQDGGEITLRTHTSGGTNNWLFGANGSITFPDASVQTTAYTGNNPNVWVQTFESQDGAPTDVVAIAASVEYDSAGNVIALFGHYDSEGGNTYYSVGKYTTTGTKIWTARFDDDGQDLDTDGWGLAVDNATDSIYVAGQSEITVGGQQWNATLTKLDAADGTIVWSKKYDFGYTSLSPVVDVASDGNPVMVGYASNGDDRYVATTKVDAADGSIIWSRALNGQNDEKAYGMAVGPDGEVVAIGYMENLGMVNTAATLYADPVSNVLWTEGGSILSVGGVTADFTFTDGIPTFTNVVDTVGNRSVDDVIITVLGDNLGGVTGVDDMVVKVGSVTAGNSDDHMLVVKYASDGTIAWQKAILFDAGFDCRGADADIDSDGNIYVTGSYQYDSGEEFGITSALSILKLDDSGGKLWSRRITGTCDTFGVSVVVGADDKLYLSAITGFAGGDTDETNGFTWVAAKYGFDGTVEWQRLIERTDTWTFAGGLFFNDGGGSNLAVKDGYVVLGGGFGLIGGDAQATVIQVAATGDTFATGAWAFTAASFSGVLNSSASDITVIDAEKTDTDNASNISVATVTPQFDSSAFLLGTLYAGGDASNQLVNGDQTLALNIDGSVTLPQGGVISETGGGDTYSILLTPTAPSYANPDMAVKIYPTFSDDNHIHITAGNKTTVDLFLGDDDQYVKIEKNAGNVVIGTNNNTHNWTFGTDGNLTIPATGDIVRDGTSIFASSTALPIVTITDANFNQRDNPLPPATSTSEGAVVFTVTSPVALTATGLLLISGSNNKGGTIVTGGTATGSQTLVFDMGGLNSTYTVMAFATTANGTSYSAPVGGNGGYVCFPAGTMITLSNGTKKAIEDIGYDDHILVWNFDLGEYASAKPLWIKASETATEYNVLTFSDGSVLKTVGNHHIFNKQAERFTHTMTADTPIGTVTVNEQSEEITLVSAEVVKESVEFYNVWTEYHLNMFAQGVLTSNRFNNTYPIVSMKFVKGNTELRALAEFNGIDPKWIQGLRLQEQTSEHTAEYIKWYVSERLEKLSISSVEMVA